MAYAIVQDVPASWEQYERQTAPSIDPWPAGLLMHVAGPTDEGYRVVEVWESNEAWSGFNDATPERPWRSTVRELHVRVLLGSQRALLQQLGLG